MTNKFRNFINYAYHLRQFILIWQGCVKTATTAKEELHLRELFLKLEAATDRYHKLVDNPYHDARTDAFADWLVLSYSLLSLSMGKREHAVAFLENHPVPTEREFFLPSEFIALFKIHFDNKKPANPAEQIAFDLEKQDMIFAWQETFSSKKYHQRWDYFGTIISELILAYHFWKSNKTFYFTSSINRLFEIELPTWHRYFTEAKWVLGRIFEDKFIEDVDRLLTGNVIALYKNAGFAAAPQWCKK